MQSQSQRSHIPLHSRFTQFSPTFAMQAVLLRFSTAWNNTAKFIFKDIREVRFAFLLKHVIPNLYPKYCIMFIVHSLVCLLLVKDIISGSPNS